MEHLRLGLKPEIKKGRLGLKPESKTEKKRVISAPLWMHFQMLASRILEQAAAAHS